jgi:hypothetical protein
MKTTPTLSPFGQALLVSAVIVGGLLLLVVLA